MPQRARVCTPPHIPALSLPITHTHPVRTHNSGRSLSSGRISPSSMSTPSRERRNSSNMDTGTWTPLKPIRRSSRGSSGNSDSGSSSSSGSSLGSGLASTSSTSLSSSSSGAATSSISSVFSFSPAVQAALEEQREAPQTVSMQTLTALRRSPRLAGRYQASGHSGGSVSYPSSSSRRASGGSTTSVDEADRSDFETRYKYKSDEDEEEEELR